jgi:uncharacterized cupin superfamily protein
MKIINTITLAEEDGLHGKKYGAIGKDVSVALGRDNNSTDLMVRHPFDVEISRIPAGRTNTLFHSHGAQWEFYHVIQGTGKVRDDSGLTPVVKGDAFIFKPGEAHQIINDSNDDLIVYVIADNPINESLYLPDEGKWVVKTPKMQKVCFDSATVYPND